LDRLILCALAAPAGSYVERSKFNGEWCIYLNELDRSGMPKLWQDRNWEYGGDRFRYTASIDAALALVERVRPDWGFQLVSAGSFHECRMWATNPGVDSQEPATGNTLPLAILACLLASMEQHE
jgi:hypothetical protein